MRGEGYTEQTGDITLTCTGGVAPALGSVIPQITITVFYNTTVTSRLLPQASVSNAISEALLSIDEPGSGLPAPVPNFGAAAPQNLCTTPLQGCVEYVSQAPGSTVPVATDTPQGTAATTPGKNVFLGIVNANSVTFNGVPMLAPGNTGSRVFRVTNVRLNANSLYAGPFVGVVPAQAAISLTGTASASMSLSTPNVYVGYITNTLSTSAGAAPSLQQCTSQSLTPATTLSFTEIVNTAFMTRVMAQNNVLYAGQNGTPGLNGFAAQNVPGTLYNSESDFVLPIAAGQTAGLADFGTRLKAQFNNVPAGVHLFVSVSNVQNSGLPVSAPAVPGGSAANSGSTGFAQLTANETGAFSAVAATGSANSGSVPVAEIAVVNGSATAVWEVINTDPNSRDILRFAVFTTYTANPAQNSPAPGTITANLTYAPGPPSFVGSSGANASDTLSVSRFVVDENLPRNVLTVNSCSQTAAPTSTALTVTPTGASNQYTLTATVTSAGSGTLAGIVTFNENGTAIAGSTTTLSAGGTANFVATLDGGPHRLTAVFAPSNSQVFASSTSPESVLNAAAPTSTVLTATPVGGNQYKLVATVTSTTPGTLAGTVTFYDSGTSIPASTTTVTSGGTATFIASLAAATPHTLSAVFTPSNLALFAPSTSPDVSLSFDRGSANIEVSSSSFPSIAGQDVTLTANVTGAGSTPTGTVQFTDGLLPLGAAALVRGRASLTVTMTAGGIHEIVAAYSGDAVNNGASASFLQRVDRIAGSLGIATSATATFFGQAVSLTVNLAPAAPAGVAAASGTVQFQEGSTVIGAAAMSSGSATLSVSSLTTGAHQIFATYGGDANWFGLRSSTVTVTVDRSATTTTLNSLATMTAMQFTASLTPAASGGSVQFLDATGNTVLGSVLPVNGVASLSLNPAVAAQIAGHPITAVYSGSAGFAGSTSSPLVLPALRNAAGGTSPEFAPEELASLYGTRLVDNADPQADATLPQALGGLSVNIRVASGALFSAGLSYVSPSQVNFLIPPGIGPGPALVTIFRSATGALVAAIPVTIARVAPGLFTASQIVRADSGAVYLVLYGTGIRNRSDRAGVACTVNGTTLQVAYAGAQTEFPGLDQVNVLLPSGLRGPATLSVSLMVDGHPSNTVTVPLE
jgi:uncharacterized protein (TIGR03437 family)